MPFFRRKKEKREDLPPPPLLPSPAPSPPIKRSPLVFEQSQDATEIVTWGKICDNLIDTNGRDHFENEYTPEMVKAYDSKILYFIPSSDGSHASGLPTTDTQSLKLVDPTTLAFKGHLVSRDPLKSIPEKVIRVYDFIKMLGSRPQEPPPGKDYSLGKKAPLFLVQWSLENLIFTIVQFSDENQAKQFINMTFESVKKQAEEFSRILRPMFPTLQKEIENAARVVKIGGEQVLVFTRICPDDMRQSTLTRAEREEFVAFMLDYAMWWQHKNLVFFVVEQNIFNFLAHKSGQYDEQNLKNALVNFENQKAYQNGLTLLRVYSSNKCNFK